MNEHENEWLVAATILYNTEEEYSRDEPVSNPPTFKELVLTLLVFGVVLTIIHFTYPLLGLNHESQRPNQKNQTTGQTIP